MVPMHHEIARAHLVGIHRAAGGLATTAHIATGTEALLAKEFTVGDQSNPPSRQLQTLKFGRAPHLQGDGGVLLNQTGNGIAVSRVRHKPTDAVVLLQQSNSSAGLCRHQPNRRAFSLKSLDQFPEFSELVGVGRNRAAGEVKAVGVLVDFEQFCHIKAMEDLRQGIGGFNLTVQNRWPEPITIALVQTRLSSHVVVMFLHMAEPLLSVG